MKWYTFLSKAQNWLIIPNSKLIGSKMAWNKKRNKSKREFCWQVKRIATTHNNNTFCCDLILIVLDFMYTAFVLRVYYIVPQTTPHVVRSQLKTMKTIISYYFYCPWCRSLFSAFIRWSVFCYCNKHNVPASKRFWIMLIRRFSWYQNTELRVERVSEFRANPNLISIPIAETVRSFERNERNFTRSQ